MAETFEQMRTEVKDSRKEPSVDVEFGEPSPTKPSTNQIPLRRSTRGDDMGRGIGTQGVEGISQASYVPDFDPSQTKKEDDWWTPMTSVQAPPPSQWEKWCKETSKGLQLSNSPLPEDSCKGFTELALNLIPLIIGPTCFNLYVAIRVVSVGKWLGNKKMDAVMFIWRVNTTLNRWAPSRIAFMSVMFYLQLDAAYNKFLPNKKSYQLPIFFWGTIEESFHLMDRLIYFGYLIHFLPHSSSTEIITAAKIWRSTHSCL
ncbi:hypothetical protein IGI04_030602 [Brassica rapa subsp. trilocularis]|uniref:Uncharacterized protein n=1 Tax=Brassica rapa subsp. trilocularis TaxID=1813537 RepID=A0ABQ7LV60_BRACM|nr:hypothetical protein IGI04_030602 [Brassica rapa subsp. trilocularis]